MKSDLAFPRLRAEMLRRLQPDLDEPEITEADRAARERVQQERAEAFAAAEHARPPGYFGRLTVVSAGRVIGFLPARPRPSSIQVPDPDGVPIDDAAKEAMKAAPQPKRPPPGSSRHKHARGRRGPAPQARADKVDRRAESRGRKGVAQGPGEAGRAVDVGPDERRARKRARQAAEDSDGMTDRMSSQSEGAAATQRSAVEVSLPTKPGVTLLYRELVMEVRKQIINTGLTMAQCDELSGNECGYTAKSLSPDSRSGRQSTYRMLQNLLDVIFIGGFTVQIKPHADREVIRGVLSKKLAARGDMLNGLSLPERVRKRGMQGKNSDRQFRRRG